MTGAIPEAVATLGGWVRPQPAGSWLGLAIRIVILTMTMTLLFNEFSSFTFGWRRGVVVSGVRRMNEVNARRARLVPGWVTVFGRVYHLGM